MDNKKEYTDSEVSGLSEVRFGLRKVWRCHTETSRIQFIKEYDWSYRRFIPYFFIASRIQ